MWWCGVQAVARRGEFVAEADVVVVGMEKIECKRGFYVRCHVSESCEELSNVM